MSPIYWTLGSAEKSRRRGRERSWTRRPGKPSPSRRGNSTELIFSAFQRHESRNKEARQADKLFHIVDKYLPLQADETRAFVARFPARVRTLLPKARKIRNRLRREGGPGSAAKEPPSEGRRLETNYKSWERPSAADRGNNPQ